MIALVLQMQSSCKKEQGLRIAPKSLAGLRRQDLQLSNCRPIRAGGVAECQYFGTFSQATEPLKR
jgi:hypothetical protein